MLKFPRFWKGSGDQDARATTSTVAAGDLQDRQKGAASASLAIPKFEPSGAAIPGEKWNPRGEAFGIFELADDPQTSTTVDVVAVHGLQGHAYKTWEHENRSLWLRDFLPKDVPSARVLTFGYDSTVALSKSVAKIEDFALELLNSLYLEREHDKADQTMRPIVFICHSLGGIVVKKALILAHERSSDPAFRDILLNTRAIAFLGVPHRGSATASYANVLASALKGACLGTATNTALVSSLKKDSTTLANISNQFVDRGKDLKIYTFYETVKIHGVCVVDKQSATIGVPNEKLISVVADHRSICRLPDRDQGMYKVIGFWSVQLIRDAVREAEQYRVLQQQQLDRQSATKRKRYFRLPANGSPFFTGRAKELETMRKLLTTTDPIFQRRVAIWGVGGAGKTQLAFHYALTYEREFSAVFCVNAADPTSLRADLLMIAKCLKLPEALGCSTTQPGDMYAQDAVVEAVKDWFTDLEDGDWLLIIDNADNLDEFDIEQYLPVTKKGCLIITSRNKQAVGYGPAIDLGEMEPEDAQELFLRRSGNLNPTQQQREICVDIVNQLGRLALAVEHGAAFVQHTGMSLQEYNRDLEQKLRPYLLPSAPFSLHKATVQATVSMAYAAVFKRNRVAAELLLFLASLDNESVLESHLLSDSASTVFRNWHIHQNRDDYFTAKRVLLAFSLIRSDISDDESVIISMHPLVHRCVSPLPSHDGQWTMILRSAFYTYTISSGKPLNGVHFRHVRHTLKTATRLFQQTDQNLSPKSLWPILAGAVSTYRIFWQVTGLVQELDELAKITIQALGRNESDTNRIMIAAVTAVRYVTIPYTNSSETSESLLQSFLAAEMAPAAAEFLRRIRDETDHQNQPVNFNPHSLAEVFKHATPPAYVDILVHMLQYAAINYLGRSDRLNLGTVYFHLSRLPKVESSTTEGDRALSMVPSLTQPIRGNPGNLHVAYSATIATQDRSSGHIDGTLALLRQIMNWNKPSEVVGLFESTSYDLAKLLRKLKRDDEATAIVKQFRYPDDQNTEIDIARRYKDYYVWVRKAYAKTFSDHADHARVESILKKTHETATEVFGSVSLSALHAALLLEEFYSQPCCHSAIAAAEIKGEVVRGLAKLYGGQAKLRQGEGLQMGKILLTQGALEEALRVLEELTALTERELGVEDEVAEHARNMLVLARRERMIEIRDEEAGRASLDWGCVTFPRDQAALGIETSAP